MNVEEIDATNWHRYSNIVERPYRDNGDSAFCDCCAKNVEPGKGFMISADDWYWSVCSGKCADIMRSTGPVTNVNNWCATTMLMLKGRPFDTRMKCRYWAYKSRAVLGEECYQMLGQYLQDSITDLIQPRF